jgi:hypothetical protein
VINVIPEEIDELVELFENQANVDESAFIRTNRPAIPYHHDKINDDSDWGLMKFIKYLGHHGNERTYFNNRDFE